MGGTEGSESFASRTTFSRLPYFCAPLLTDSRPLLCYSRLQVNEEDQKPGFNFQTVPKLNVLVRFLAFVHVSCVMLSHDLDVNKLKGFPNSPAVMLFFQLEYKFTFPCFQNFYFKHWWMLNGNFKTLLDERF